MMLRFLLAGLALLSTVVGNPTGIKRALPGRVVPAGNPVLVDPRGVYMRVTFMNDGSLLGAYTGYETGVLILRAVRSTDGGNTWGYLGEVFRGDPEFHDIENAMALQLASGRLVYAYRNHDRANKRFKWFRISMSYSDDGGRNWKYLSTVEEKAPNPNGDASGLWEPFLRIARDGSLQCYYSAENNTPDQDGFMKYSRDGGLTWSRWMAVSGGDVVSRDGMIGVAPTDNNGNLIAVFEETLSVPDHFAVSAVFSHDDGISWGERRVMYVPRNGGNAGAPQIYNVWGTLVLSFMTDEDTGSSGYDGGQMKVMTSTDGGRTWGPSVVVGPAKAHWPGIFNVDPTHFLALYSRDGFGLVTQRYELVF